VQRDDSDGDEEGVDDIDEHPPAMDVDSNTTDDNESIIHDDAPAKVNTADDGGNGKNELREEGEAEDDVAGVSSEVSVCLIFMAHAGVNQTELWERWYSSGSTDERARIHVVWWMDTTTDASRSPTLVAVSSSSASSAQRMFRDDNRCASTTTTYRNHHSQATIEFELLRFAYNMYPSCHHYHLVSGACFPIKPPSMFLSPFLPSQFSHLCITTNDRTVHKLAVDLGIAWFNSAKLGYVHFQFWILNHTHTRLLIRLIFNNDDGIDYVGDLVRIQRAYFAKKKMPQYKYDDLTNPTHFPLSAYNVTLVSPCEWFVHTLLVQAVRKYTDVTDIPDIHQHQLNRTHGIFQHHVRHGHDKHPIEYPDLDTKVNVHYSERRLKKRQAKVGEYRQASLREVLSEDVMSASLSYDQPLALWKDGRVLIVRKIGTLPLKENTWPSQSK
jgi:hypothetical protein